MHKIFLITAKLSEGKLIPKFIFKRIKLENQLLYEHKAQNIFIKFMKNSPSHLPQNKQAELAKITRVISQDCSDVTKIILFGSYARGDYKEKKDLDPNAKTGHVSDYDILVVTGKKDSVTKFTAWDKEENLNLSAPLRITACNIDEMNERLSEGHYFFSDVKKEGILLFDDKKFKLARKTKFSKEEKKTIAKKYFEHWFGLAQDFYGSFEMIFIQKKIQSIREQKSNGLAAFHLHQAAEHCYKTILLVFNNYSPNEHFLKTLGNMAQKYCPEIATLFPQNTQIEKDRFKLLDYAYIGGRYDMNYKISQKDLENLAQDVKKLLEITKKVCEYKII